MMSLTSWTAPLITCERAKVVAVTNPEYSQPTNDQIALIILVLAAQAIVTIAIIVGIVYLVRKFLKKRMVTVPEPGTSAKASVQASAAPATNRSRKSVKHAKSMKTCAACGKPIPETAMFCPSCGSSQQ